MQRKTCLHPSIALLAALVWLCAVPGALAVPQHCDIECTFDPLKTCTTSCWNGWRTTTCGSYNGVCYNLPVCGNASCESVPPSAPQWLNETHSNCPLDCTDGSTSERNACVPHVVTKFNQISTSDKTFKINNHGGSATGQTYWENLENATSHFPDCHFQGIARLNENPWVAMVANNTDTNGALCAPWPLPAVNGPRLFIARMGSKSGAGNGPWGSGWSPSQDQVQFHIPLGDPSEQWHPGGMQAIGDYLLLGIDSDTYLYTVKVEDLDSSDPEVVEDATIRLDGLAGELSGDAPDVSAHAVGVVRDVDGRYLVATNFNNGNAWMFRSQSTDIEDPDYKYLGPILWSNSSQIRGWDGSGLVRECGTDILYMITFYNTVPFGITGENKAQLWRLDVDVDAVYATYLQTRNFGDASGAFFAGVGLYVQGTTGRMAIYSSERFPDGAFIGGSNKDLDCDEWW